MRPPTAQPTSVAAVRRGFTLVELIVTMAIIGILTGIVVVQLRKGERMSHLWAAADELQAAWQEMQARALAGVPTPPSANDVAGNPAGDLPTNSYGLFLYGTLPVSSEPDCFTRTNGLRMCPVYIMDDDAPLLPLSFTLAVCAMPEEAAPFTPRPDRCWVTLDEYSPVLPPHIYVDRGSIRIGASTSTMLSYIVNPEGEWGFVPSWDFDTCTESSIGEDYPFNRYVYLAATPPQPQYSVNGGTGCRYVDFAIRSDASEANALWVRFDLNTGRMSVSTEVPS